MITREDIRHKVISTANGIKNLQETSLQGLAVAGIAVLLEKLPPNMAQDVADFHHKFGVSYDGPPRMLEPQQLRDFREERLDEERMEYLTSPTLEGKLDGLIDLMYFAHGNLQLHGFTPDQINEAWRRVHAANMKKELCSEKNPSKRGGEGFDIVKPPGWVAPDLSDLCAIPPITGGVTNA